MFGSLLHFLTHVTLDCWNSVVCLQGQCCGVVKAEDWGNQIPESCECASYGGSGSECRDRPQVGFELLEYQV